MEIKESEYLEHYGTPRHSGRYPWGSGGEDANTKNKDFIDHVDELRKQGLSEKEIAIGTGLGTTTKLRAHLSNAKNARRQANIDMAQRLKEKGLSNTAIGERLGLPESTVRSYLAPGAAEKSTAATSTANFLRKEIESRGAIDVGTGVDQHLNVSSTTLNNAVALLQDQGYPVHYLQVPQLGTVHNTSMKVLASPGTPWTEVNQNKEKIVIPGGKSEDHGKSIDEFQPPLAIHPDRVGIVYKDQGGDLADGVVYVRRGVDDVSLGKAQYAQVRVQVGDDKYIKGMAMYKDDMPDGVDLLFNTNKDDTGNKLDALKPIDKDNPDSPFGATIRDQIFTRNPDGSKKVTSSMNLVNQEGDWMDWDKNIASQVLSKQSTILAKSQLNMAYEERLSEYKEITSLTNPTVRKKLLKSFADETDAAAVHLKAAQLPRQGWHVILPMSTIPESQIYAPNYRDGERVVLIRYPHGGIFEIPELTVNNNHGPSKSILENARDAVAIHPKVAERLSGADFDGDTVLVIPNNQNKIKTAPALDKLRGFNPRTAYPKYDGMKVMTDSQKAAEMGSISNLITDMTIKGAPHSEIASAVRHSMVVIDAKNHELNWKQSAIDNGISDLKRTYQGGPRGGAATIISKARREERIPKQKERLASRGGPIDPITGRKVFELTGEIDRRTGKPATMAVKMLANRDDAHLLSSGTPMERLYADHSNNLKSLANTARLSYIRTPRLQSSSSAKKVYANEVTSLKDKLAIAHKNAPLERQAQILGNYMVKARRAANPDMDKATLKKVKAQSLETARTRTKAKKTQIRITPHEWEAIQGGAISDSMLMDILDNADLDIVKELATPKTRVLMSPLKIDRAQAMLANGATRAEVASQLGVSLSTLDRGLHGE